MKPRQLLQRKRQFKMKRFAIIPCWSRCVPNGRSVLSLKWYELFFYVNAECERFTAAGSHCRQNLKLGFYTVSFDGLHQRSVFFPHSVHWFVTLALAFLCLANGRSERSVNDHFSRRTPQGAQHSQKNTLSGINRPD